MATVPLEFARRSAAEMQARATAFHAHMARRRTVRAFAPDPVPRQVIEACLRTAGTAPSGAHQQPWHFVAISEPGLKRRIREAAEAEERAFYGGRAPAEWLTALAPLGTDADKPFLEIAPWLIAVFARPHGRHPDGRMVKHYYVQESVGIATGLLVAALHDAGLATLTHTPSPMRFLNTLLERPASDRPFLILVAGFPAADVRVPDLQRKALEEIATFVE
jgi:nitroreductase